MAVPCYAGAPMAADCVHITQGTSQLVVICEYYGFTAVTSRTLAVYAVWWVILCCHGFAALVIALRALLLPLLACFLPLVVSSWVIHRDTMILQQQVLVRVRFLQGCRFFCSSLNVDFRLDLAILLMLLIVRDSLLAPGSHIQRQNGVLCACPRMEPHGWHLHLSCRM